MIRSSMVNGVAWLQPAPLSHADKALANIAFFALDNRAD